MLMICCATVFSTVAYSARLPEESIFSQKDPVKLEIKNNDNSKTIKFPAIKKLKGKIACLKFKAYFKSDIPAGWNNTLAISLNGHELDKSLLNGTKRLLSRGEVLLTNYTRSPKNAWWSHFQGSNCLLMLVGPGKGEIDKRIIKPREEGYNYTLDISDRVNYIEYGADDRIENAAPNQLTFTNKLLRWMIGEKSKIKYLAVENIEVVYIPTEAVDKARDATLYKFKPGKSAAVLENKNFKLEVTPSGGMQLKAAGVDYYLESFFSYPASPEMKDNKLGTCSAAGQKDWKPSVLQVSKTQIEVTAKAGDYELKRIIKLDPPRIRFQDHIKNTSSKAVGVRVRNLFGIKGMPRPGSWRIAGFSGTSFAEFSFSTKNPTMFLETGKSSLGLVVEDNIYRVMLQLRKKNNIFIAGAENFALGAGKSHTFEWTLYPGENNGYFGFINQVRKDWNVNYTVQSAILVGDRGHKSTTKQNVFVIGPWFEYHNGSKYTDDQFKKIYTDKIKTIKSARPAALVIPKLENNLVPFCVTDYPDAKALPARKGARTDPGVKYGLFLNKKLTEIVDRSHLKDSIIRSADGRAMVENFYTKYPFINLMVQPERDNARYKDIMRQMDFLTDDCGFDGIFMDQFIPMPLGGISYDKWDGVSVELNKDGTIKSKYYSYALTGASARLDIIKHVTDKGKMYIHNGLPLVKETRSVPAMRFQEMENDPIAPMTFIDSKPPELKWVSLAHLSSPITLGLRLKRYSPKGEDRSAQILMKGIITALRNGSLYYYYTMDIGKDGSLAPSDHMFPFTPVEINEGFLIGKERIITCLSRSFVWPGKAKPKVLLFDKCGNLKKNDFKIEKTEKGWQVEIKLNDWNEIAIIKDNQ
jgi:hypothetical protein